MTRMFPATGNDTTASTTPTTTAPRTRHDHARHFPRIPASLTPETPRLPEGTDPQISGKPPTHEKLCAAVQLNGAP